MRRISRYDLAKRTRQKYKSLFKGMTDREKEEGVRFRGKAMRGQDVTRLIYDDMEKLGEKPDPDKVDEIMGNKSFTSIGRCAECGEEANEMVVLAETDRFSGTALCLKCVLAAMILLDQ